MNTINTDAVKSDEVCAAPEVKKKRGRQPKYNTEAERIEARRKIQRAAKERKLQAMSADERETYIKNLNEVKMKWYYDHPEQAQKNSLKMRKRYMNAYRIVMACQHLISAGATFDDIKNQLKEFNK